MHNLNFLSFLSLSGRQPQEPHRSYVRRSVVTSLIGYTQENDFFFFCWRTTTETICQRISPRKRERIACVCVHKIQTHKETSTPGPVFPPSTKGVCVCLSGNGPVLERDLGILILVERRRRRIEAERRKEQQQRRHQLQERRVRRRPRKKHTYNVCVSVRLPLSPPPRP